MYTAGLMAIDFQCLLRIKPYDDEYLDSDTADAPHARSHINQLVRMYVKQSNLEQSPLTKINLMHTLMCYTQLSSYRMRLMGVYLVVLQPAITDTRKLLNQLQYMLDDIGDDDLGDEWIGDLLRIAQGRARPESYPTSRTVNGRRVEEIVRDVDTLHRIIYEGGGLQGVVCYTDIGKRLLASHVPAR